MNFTLPRFVTKNKHTTRSTINGKTAGPNQYTLNRGHFVKDRTNRTIDIAYNNVNNDTQVDLGGYFTNVAGVYAPANQWYVYFSNLSFLGGTSGASGSSEDGPTGAQSQSQIQQDILDYLATEGSSTDVSSSSVGSAWRNAATANLGPLRAGYLFNDRSVISSIDSSLFTVQQQNEFNLWTAQNPNLGQISQIADTEFIYFPIPAYNYSNITLRPEQLVRNFFIITQQITAESPVGQILYRATISHFHQDYLDATAITANPVSDPYTNRSALNIATNQIIGRAPLQSLSNPTGAGHEMYVGKAVDGGIIFGTSVEIPQTPFVNVNVASIAYDLIN